MRTRSDTVVDPQTAEEMRRDQTPGADPKGSSGRPLWAGRPVGWEPNRKFADGVWFSETVRRLEVNPSVDIGIRAYSNLLLTAKVKVGGRRANKEAAEFLRRQWGLEGRRARLLRDTWESSYRRAIRAIFQGAVVMEWVTRIVVEGGRRWIYLTRLHDRHMSTVVAWLTDEFEQLVGVRQAYTGPRGGARNVDIPVSQLLVLSYRPRGSTDHDGHGLLRPMAEEVTDHTGAGALMRMAAKKFGLGELHVKIPDQRGGPTVPGQDLQKAKADEEARAKQWLRTRNPTEDGGIVTTGGWEVVVLGGADNYDPSKLVTQRSHYNENILRGLNSDYILVASSEGSGGYNAAAAKQAAAGTSAQNDADWVLGEIDCQINEPLIRMNFPGLDLDEYPRLQATGLRAPVYVQMAPVIPQLVQAGLIKSRTADDARIRSDMEMAEDDEPAPTAVPAEGAAA